MIELYKYRWTKIPAKVYTYSHMPFDIFWNHQTSKWCVLTGNYKYNGSNIAPWLLTTDDFVTFTEYVSNPFFYDNNIYCVPMNMFWDADISKWIMSYFGPNGGGGESIAFATGDTIFDLSNANGYVLIPNISPAPTGSVSLFPSGFMKVGSTYWLAVDVSYTSVDRIYEIHLYSSSDLVNWTANGLLIPKGSSGQWDESSIYNGRWIYIASEAKYYYYYGGNNGGYTLNRNFGVASCSTINGVYTKHGLILDPSVEAKGIIPFYNPLELRYELYYREKPVADWETYKALSYINMGYDKINNSVQKTLGLYDWQSSSAGDTVGDTRKSNQSSWLIEEICTVANAVRGSGTWILIAAKRVISLTDSNEAEGAGTYLDLVSGKSGRGTIVFGDAAGYADFIFTTAGVVTLLAWSSNVFTALQTGTNHVIIKDNGSNVRITNELGSTTIFNVEIKYTN